MSVKPWLAPHRVLEDCCPGARTSRVRPNSETPITLWPVPPLVVIRPRPSVTLQERSKKMTLVGIVRSRVNRALERDRTWVALLAAVFALTLAASWQRWSDPIVDVGREMNQPLRLVAGERLYSDVRHIYGPLSPWLHAALYRAFGPSLTLLYADGIFTAAAVLALVFWLARQILSPAAAAAATMNVMALCVFKPAGNYILPYSFNSLHGAALGLITLTILTRALRRAHGAIDAPGPSSASLAGAQGLTAPVLEQPRTGPGMYWRFLAAGLTAGLAILAKTEMGAAAVAAGLTAAVLAAHGDVRRTIALAATFAVAAGLLACSVYAVVLGQVGWRTLAVDSWLLLYNMPPEIAYFNGQVSGLAHPLRSLARMLIALAKIGILATLLAAISTAVVAYSRPAMDDRSNPDDHDPRAGSRPWRLLAAALAGALVVAASTGLDPDKGPFLAMPFLLVGLLASLAFRLRRERTAHTATLITFAVFALVSLARIILHVRSGGAYASYLLPMSVVILTYLWVDTLAGRFRSARAGRVNRRIVLALIMAAGIVNAGVLAYRFRSRSTVAVSTARGTMVSDPEIGQAFNEALAYIARYTAPTDAIAVLPEGTALTFLSSRRNPLREEIITPGYLDAESELRAIRQLRDANTALILIPNRPTREFGPAVFGRHYCQRLMRWIDTHYAPCAIFGPVKDPSLQIGDPPFFLRAYCRRGAAPSQSSGP